MLPDPLPEPLTAVSRVAIAAITLIRAIPIHTRLSVYIKRAKRGGKIEEKPRKSP
jgi:hypothetical protein